MRMWLVIESGPEAGRSARVEGERFPVARGVAICAHPDGHFELRDEGTPDGVFVEGERVTEPVALNGDETIRVGDDVLLRLSLDEPSAEPTVEVPAGRWRALVRSVRETRLAVKRAIAAAGMALAVALLLGVLVVTGVIGGDGDEGSVADVVEKVTPSTVLVRTRAGRGEATGSGFALAADEGLVVTNFHVINGGDKFDVRVGGDFRDAKVVGAAPCDDLALLQVDDADGLRDLSLGSQGDLEQGQEVVALGFPANPSLRGELTSTAGVVSVPRSAFVLPIPGSPRFRNLIQTDAALNPGSSGGPLVDSDGRLVGVNTALYAAREGPASTQGYAIGVDRVKRVVADLREGRSQGWLGAGVSPPPPRLVRRAGHNGLLITAAVPGTFAAAAGLEGVLLTSFNGRALDGTLAGYCRAAKGLESGDSVDAEVIVAPGGAPKRISLDME
jgi:S1-C subfamily serine protease